MLLACAALMTAPATAQSAFDPFGLARIDDRAGARVPVDAPFRDAQGHPTTLRRIAKGRPLLLVPVLHRCPNLCGVTLAGLSRAVAGQDLAPDRDFAVVALGIDPREGPAQARADLADLAREAPIAGAQALTGSARSIRAVTQAIGYRYAWDPRIGQYAHAAASAVLTPEGRLSGWIYGLSPSPQDLNRALSAARQDRSGHWGEALLLLCYHYDAVTGRYTPAIEAILRAAAALTVLALLLGWWRLRRRRA